MKRSQSPGLWVIAVCISLLAVSAFAQSQSGNIYGKVQAKDGSALPGVTVTLTGVGAPQTTVSDAQGNFLVGEKGTDTIRGLGGDDTIDTLDRGGPANVDHVDAGVGNDYCAVDPMDVKTSCERGPLP
jgi:Ca2+-binding RTX toxin-like protein